MLPLYRVLRCDYINPKSDTSCEIVVDGALVLKRYGQAYRIEKKGTWKSVQLFLKGKRSLELIETNGVVIPAFYDMHFHWVQDEVCLMPKDNLLDWLKNYTWPYEQKFESQTFSLTQAQRFGEKLKKQGSVGGLCYSSVHAHSVDHALLNFRGNFSVGHVLMDMNSPPYLEQDTESEKKLIAAYAKKYKSRYAITPRFAPTTSVELMSHGAKVQRAFGSFIQTHLSETREEIEYVLSIFRSFPGFKKVKNYTEIYEQVGLLGEKTFLGHGIYLSDQELSLIKKRKSWIVHCPSSNAPLAQMGLGSGLFDFRRADQLGVKWVLGSDIGGGPFLSMLDVMASFVQQNRAIKNKEATWTRALCRATLWGARGMGIAAGHGNLELGKFADLVVLPGRLSAQETAENFFESLLMAQFLGPRDYSSLTGRVFVKGIE